MLPGGGGHAAHARRVPHEHVWTRPDPATGLPRCSGPTPPEGLDEATEGSGRGLCPPSVEYPILQTYVDVCVSGCLEYGDDFGPGRKTLGGDRLNQSAALHQRRGA